MTMSGEMFRDDKPADFLLPESVKSWFTLLYTQMISGNVEEMARLYDREFNQLSNNYFKQTKWPEPDAIKSLVDEDETFMVLYTQIYYRHMFAKLPVGIEEKFASWKNYCEIFDGILNKSLELDALPAQWAYDIIGEFVYQYQSFCQYLIKLPSRSEGEIARFRQYAPIWDTKTVLGYLNKLVSVSNIEETLQSQQGLNDAAIATSSDAITTMGYFSLFGLSRAFVLYGDYSSSLRILESINFSKKGVYSKSPSCHISAFYHMGFAQMMLQRYSDAVRTLSALVVQVNRSKQFYSRLSHYDQVIKLCDKAIALLAISVSLSHGQRVEDQVHSLIREKYGDKLSKMQKGDMNTFREVFSFASPKFIYPVVALPEDVSTFVPPPKPVDMQMDLFLEEVLQQEHASTITSYLKLYSSIELSKFSALRDMNEAESQAQLMSFKLKNYQGSQHFNAGLVIKPGRALASSNVNCFISKDLIQVDERKIEHRYGDYFIHNINKMKDVLEDAARGQ